MRFAKGNMAVIEGRELTKEDTENQSKVCVVSRDFAEHNKLTVGDRITLKLGTELFEQYKGLGAVAAVRERYSRPEKEVELKIVGIYTDTDGKNEQVADPNWAYSVNTIFVPQSLLPVEEEKLRDHMFSPSEFSFTVDNTWDIPDVVEKINELDSTFKEIGINNIIFYDSGWMELVQKYKRTVNLLTVNIALLTIALVTATGLITYLFIGRKKKEYAIMRALGTSKKDSAKNLLIPLMILTGFAVVAGSAAAWIYTTNMVSNQVIDASLSKYAVDTSIPLPTAIGCMIGELLVVLAFALYWLWRIGRIPPLMLLQENPNKAKVKESYGRTFQKATEQSKL